MALKRDELHPARGKQRHIRDLRQVVGIYEQLKLWLKFKAVLMQKPRCDGVVSRQGFYKRCAQYQLFVRLRDIDKRAPASRAISSLGMAPFAVGFMAIVSGFAARP